MELADIRAATVVRVCDGGYRVEGDTWSVDLAATSEADALAAAIEWKRLELVAAKVEEIKAALAESDTWVLRDREDGISLTPDRITYRQALRNMIAKAQIADDPSALALPDVPAWPGGGVTLNA